MCLLSNHFLPKFTFKPIKVYKCLIEGKRESLYAPYYPGFRYECGVIYKNSLSFRQLNYAWKGSGFFHSFLYLDGALQLKCHLEILKALYSVVIYECEIPRFSFYYTGYHINTERWSGEICSTKLRVVRKVCI